ncbi:MAG: metal-dependent hydrolase, partial [Gammaproteobacteria bacterium]
YHRQFTHSLVFIPIGSLFCAGLMYVLFARRWKISFYLTYIFCFLGYATHGFIDACTSYGTQLFWPFSDHRVAWNTMSIVDPMLTGPLLVLMFFAVVLKKVNVARAALCWLVIYQAFGIFQHLRVEAIGEQIAAERGHTPIRLEVKPSFANLLLWKVIYEIEDGYYTDAVRAGPKVSIYYGDFIPKFNVDRDMPWLDKDSQQYRDLQRFSWFSRGFLAMDPSDPLRVTDMRYSLVPNEGTGMWSIWLDKNATKDQHVRLSPDRDTSGPKREKFAQMLRDEEL